MELFGADSVLPRPTSPEPQAGHLLVASPAVADPLWRRSVILILSQGDDGAVGVIINKRAMLSGEALPDWIASADEVLMGGPVSQESLIGIGESGSSFATSKILPSASILDLDMMETADELDVHLQPPTRWRLFAGYAGWGEQQLAEELARGDWVVLPGLDSDLLDTDPSSIWAAVLSRQPYPLRLWADLPEDPGLN